MLHECDAECKEFTDKDCYFDKWVIGEWKFRRCPRTFITEDVSQYLLAYRMFEKGFMPNGKGWAEQSSKFVEAVLFIDNLVQKLRQEKANGRQ